MRLGLQLLGGVRATIDGLPVAIGGRRPRTLLATLALADGHVVSTDRLVDLLWGDDPPPTARRTLQSYVSDLRRILGGDEGPLSASGAGYILAIDHCDVDLFVFADTVARAKDETAANRVAAAARLDAALRSWAVPLDGLRPSLGLQAIVAPYEELRLEALEALNDVELDYGDVGRAVGRLEMLVREHPVRERFWAQLVGGLATLGRRDAALQASQRARESLREHLGVNPSPLLQHLERQVLDGGPLRSPNAGVQLAATAVPRWSLVRPATEFIGRTAELHDGTAALASRRLVTLTGAGGVGKTRLAIELAWLMLEEFPGGVWLVELAPVADPSAVVAAVASTLAIPLQRDMTMVESVVDWLRGRRLLLILDNCEHVLTPVVDLVAAVVAGCPTVTVLATSREPLGVPGERVHLVPPVDPASEGVELFCDRGLAADASFRASDEDRAAIAAICERLDGIPLAIELAASRIRAFAPADLLAHLDERFGLLHGSGRGGSDRHQTMRVTFGWSYQLLDERERLLFDRMSVFAGGFALADAEDVCADDESLDQGIIVSVVGSLVDKSMVRAERSQCGTRYRVLEPMRRYGEERLHERGATKRMQDRHLDHYVDVAQRANQLWSSPRQVDADAIFDRDWDNLRAAHAWAVTAANLAAADAVVAATGPHAWCRMRHEHGDWAARTLTIDGIERADATTYGWAAYWSYVANDRERLIEYARQGIDAAPAPEHPEATLCWAVLVNDDLASGNSLQTQEHSAHARVAAADNPDAHIKWWVLAEAVDVALETDRGAVPDLMAQLASLADKIGSPSLHARTEFYKGRQRMWVDEPSRVEGALACYRSGLDLARKAGDIHNANLNLLGIMFANTALRDPDAGEACKEAITRLYDARHWSAVWLALSAVALWWEAIGNLEGVAVICGHLEAHRPVPWIDVELRVRDQPTLSRHRRLNQLMVDGGPMDRDQLVSFVLEELADSSHTAPRR